MINNRFGCWSETTSITHLLSFERNRYVIHYFQESSDTVASLEDLVEYVMATRDETAHTDPEHIAVGLHHSTLPKLAKEGIIDYDTRQNTVRYWGHPTLEGYSVGSTAPTKSG